MTTKHTPKVRPYRQIAIAHSLDEARLINQAPETAAERDRLKAVNAELLAALEHLLDEVSAGSKSLDFNNGKKAARAAIAKARGE